MPTHLTLIHGWGVNQHIFDDFRRRLPENWHIHAPDLLGHGANADDFNIAAAAHHIAAQMTEPNDVFGWSLGGLVALHLALHYPQKVKRLILCASFAKLLAEPDYPEGLSQSSLGKMIPLFEQDYPKYMRQFLELQLLHSPHRAEILQNVLPDVAKCGAPRALRAALDAVEQADFRRHLAHIQQPSLLIYGDKDAITPQRMGAYLAQHLPNARLQIVAKSAHAPFLSHADEVAQIVQDWCK